MAPEAVPGIVDTSMPLPSFRLWLEHRREIVPDAGALALALARSGVAGMSRDNLRRLAGIPPDTLDDLLRAMLASGQVVVLKRDGQLVYRMAG